MHGYDPEKSPEMRAIFFALGRGVPRGEQLGAVRGLDVAATVARLLGIAPPAQNEGVPIAKIRAEKVQPVPMALRVLPRLLYGAGHPYGNPFTGSGTVASVARISRDDMVRFHER